MTTSNSTHSAYRPDIDGLRAIAVLAVIFFHAFPSTLRGGFIGVDIFFVISGYLISSILMKEHEAGNFSYARFYARRIRRLFPALVVVLAFVFILGWFSLFADEFAQLGKHIVGGGLFSANLVFWSEAGYFDTDSSEKMLLHLWSLGIEEQFYIFWPIILGIIWKPRWVLKGIILILGLSFAINLVTTRSDETAAFYFPVSRFWELLTGSLLAYQQFSLPSAHNRFSNTQSIVGLALLITGFVVIQESSPFPGYWALLPVLGAALIINAGPKSRINHWLLSNKLMVGIGLISYPLYLWHWPIMAFIRISKDDLNRPYAIRAILLSFLLAWITYRFIERPFRSGPIDRRKIVFLSASMVVLVCAGLATLLSDGVPQRQAANTVDPMLYAQTLRYRENLQQREHCVQWLKLPSDEVSSSNCFTTSASPEIAMMGDSHVGSLQLAARAGQIDFPSVSFSIVGCLPFEFLTARRPIERPDVRNCRAGNSAALSAIEKLPSVKTVIISARGPFYLTGRDFGNDDEVDLHIYNSEETVLMPEVGFLEGYSDTISRLQAAGKRVVLVTDWPELNIDPRGCIGSRLIHAGKSAKSSDCSFPRALLNDRQRDYRRLFSMLQDMYPEISIYDPLALFCDKERCYGMRDNKLYYKDDDHLSPMGSLLVLTDLKKWLSNSMPSEAPQP